MCRSVSFCWPLMCIAYVCILLSTIWLLKRTAEIFLQWRASILFKAQYLHASSVLHAFIGHIQLTKPNETKKDRWNFFCSDEQAFYSRHNMYMRCLFCMPLLGHIQLTKPNWNLFLLQTVCSFLLPSMRMFLCLEACFCLVVNCLWFVASFGVICIQRLYSQHTMCSSRLI